jgi:hypothetical protein
MSPHFYSGLFCKDNIMITSCSDSCLLGCGTVSFVEYFLTALRNVRKISCSDCFTPLEDMKIQQHRCEDFKSCGTQHSADALDFLLNLP